jgi:hypothetical protein
MDETTDASSSSGGLNWGLDSILDNLLNAAEKGFNAFQSYTQFNSQNEIEKLKLQQQQSLLNSQIRYADQTAAASAYSRAQMAAYLPWIIVGGAGLVGFYLLRK